MELAILFLSASWRDFLSSSSLAYAPRVAGRVLDSEESPCCCWPWWTKFSSLLLESCHNVSNWWMLTARRVLLLRFWDPEPIDDEPLFACVVEIIGGPVGDVAGAVLDENDGAGMIFLIPNLILFPPDRPWVLLLLLPLPSSSIPENDMPWFSSISTIWADRRSDVLDELAFSESDKLLRLRMIITALLVDDSVPGCSVVLLLLALSTGYTLSWAATVSKAVHRCLQKKVVSQLSVYWIVNQLEYSNVVIVLCYEGDFHKCSDIGWRDYCRQ